MAKKIYLVAFTLVSLLSLFTSAPAQADFWDDLLRPRPPESAPGYSCTAADNGFEEHWGGHRSCGECLAEHGNCTERCYATSYTCTITGVDENGGTQTFEGYSNYSQYDARQRGLDRCYWSRLNNCQVTGCNSRQELVSRRSCQR